MYDLLSSIQKILLEQKAQKLRDLKYRNLTFYTKPDPAPFDYFVIDPPMSNDSKQTRQELTDIVSLVNRRTDQDITDLLLIDKDPLFLYLEFFQNKDLVFPVEYFSSLYTVLYPIIKQLKLFFNRPRPNQIAEFYNVDINIINTQTHSTPSYPSGHVAYAKLAEMIASEAFPEYAQQFQSFTEKVALARMQQGVHFNSDNNASIELVSKIFTQLKESLP